MLPDLRRRATLADAESWKAVVIDGVLAERGMRSFARWMTPEDAEAVRAYVAGRAAVLRAREGEGGGAAR